MFHSPRNRAGKAHTFGSLLFTATLSLGVARPAQADGGAVLPPNAILSGYSLADAARESALFFTSGNNLDYSPRIPIQTLYTDFSKGSFTIDSNLHATVTGGNAFTVSPGTPFFVPFLYIDDSPPIIGIFPPDASTAADYVFDPAQNGVHDVAIEVDGTVTTDLKDYVVGPVETVPLLDGGGTHLLTLATFLSPLSPGQHTVSIQGFWDGKAFAETLAPMDSPARSLHSLSA